MSAQSTGLQPVYRHPLGLPAGSVRALIALLIAGQFWLYLLMPADQTVRIPLHLYAQLALVLVFFVAHGRSIGPNGARHKSPWGLPRGFIRLLLVLGFAGAVVWQYMNNPDLLRQRLTPTAEMLPQWPNVLAALAIGFGLGLLMKLTPWRNRPGFQDLQAWVSLLAIFGLVAELIIVLFIRPNLHEAIDLNLWENILTGVVAYYFGLRS